jgi:glycosyltransferase involved in cell wall biosynthesis
MKFAIITHVQHIKNDNYYFGYAPYIREMNIWLQNVDEVQVIAPLVEGSINPIHVKYIHSKLHFIKIPELEITSLQNIIKTIFKLPKLFNVVYMSMAQADHIHLRCPGNMGLIGCLVQIFFPKKKKTAKYAGNWDPKAKQPWSYRLQKWLLSNTFLTRNMQVLVYGEWPNQTKNVKPFFTATYSESEIQNLEFSIQNKSFPTPNSQLPTSFLFVGTLSKGKQPLYAIQLVEQLHRKGIRVTLDLYGDGVLRGELECYIAQHNLEAVINLLGNQSKEKVLKAYQQSHFLILPSKSEGWPKVVAEAMFWGCIPMVTPVSCLLYMLGNGSRGLILSENSEKDTMMLETFLKDNQTYSKMSQNAMNWSRQFTTDEFEKGIKQIVLGTSVA